MANNFVQFHRMWLIQNISGLSVSLAVVSIRFLFLHPTPGAAQNILQIIWPCLFLILGLPAVIIFLNRESPFEVSSKDEAPPAMWRMAKACSFLVIGLNIALAVTVESVSAYAKYSLLPIILSGWIGINIGNLIHYYRQKI